MSQPVAGWYPDPTGAGPLRYWDGAQWTEHTQATNQDTAWATAAGATGQRGGHGAAVTSAGVIAPNKAWPWWSWLIVAVVLALVIAGVMNAVTAADGRSATGDANTDDNPAADVAEPAPGSTATWESRNGVARFSVPEAWRETSDIVIKVSPSFDEFLAGTWNTDGLPSAAAKDFLTVFEYTAQVYEDDYTVTEFLAQDWYSGWLMDLEVEDLHEEAFVTASGYDAWRGEAVAVENGVDITAIQYVLRNGSSELSFTLYRYGELDGYEDGPAAMIDSVEFLLD